MPQVSSVLLFHPGALGDVINTLPALAALRRRWPEARITGLGQMELMQLLQAAGVLEQGRSLELPGLHALFHPELEPPPDLVAFLHNFDLAVSWMRDRAGVFPRRLKELGLSAVFHPGPFPPPPGSGPASRWYAEPLRSLGLEPVSEPPRLELTPAQRAAWLSSHPELLGAKYLVIHPGSGSPRKNWPAKQFARLAAELTARLDQRVVILEGPADRAAVTQMKEASRGASWPVLSGLLLPELAAVLAGAAVVAGNDSGVLHLAGAVGAPTVAVFVAGDPELWGVNQPQARNLGPGQASLEAVVKAVRELLHERFRLQLPFSNSAINLT